ncbi:MAG: PD40 domain-containing protein [Myxococcales bacterium]|nr:PD40 domain-containing protein [Myxococcales bacterium]
MRGVVVRGLLAALVALIALALPPGRRAEAAFDPALRFYTIETEHFRVTYHTGLEQVAQHVANTCESIHANMTEAMGYTPTKDKTEVVLTDTSESANGSATALPYNAIRLLVTAPEDFSPLGDVDDWFLELVTHEYTHVLHTDHIRGIPALVNTVIGKTMSPNQMQPRWILEGYGVYFESARTSAGRLRNSMWDMYMRTDVLDDNLASLDQISNVVRRWPQGNIFYLYGSHFIQWIARTYGEKALRQVTYDYGGQLIPWGIQRTIRRVTGKTYDELYPLWIESMKREYGAQAAEVRRRGIREGTRLTHHGQVARYPRWIPDNAWPEHAGGLLYYRDDQRYRAGLFALDVTRDASGRVLRADEKGSELVARTNVESFASFLPDGGLVFGGAEVYRNVFVFGDLERMEPGQKSPYGAPDGQRVQLTAPAMRAADPTTSPDGRRVVFTQNKAGTRTIHIGDLEPTGVSNIRPLVPTAFLEQSFTPRWSPDGTHVAYSVWKRGGYRDIRYVDVRDGTSREITNDRAVDGSPSFSADGKWLFFHSDRTGIMNVFAYELATGRLMQVTNVLTGAYSPEPSPDGKTLAYIGYGKNGFDLYAMPLGPLDGSTWLEAPEYIDTHPIPPPVTDRRWEPKPYNPWRTLLPRRYGVQVTPGNFGQAVIVTAAGSDIAGLHGVSATSTVELEKPQIQGSLAYSYSGLPVDFGASVFRSITPRAGYAIGQYKPTIIQETLGVTTSLSYAQPKAFDGRSYVVSHTVSRVGANLPMPADKLDPYETPSIPVRGLASTMHFGYAFSNAERYLWSIGPERGYALNLNFDITDPLLGSDFAGFATNGDFTTYFLMPWLKHHSLALHAGGGTSGGSFPGRGAFFVGGFVDLPVVDMVRNVMIQGGITLRGYAPVAVAGRSYALGNAEYRFPIVNIDRGQSTLPVFLNRINGSLFVDYGSAFDVFRDARFKTGVGGELWFDTLLGYVVPFTFRLGYAKGLASLGIDKVYFVAAVPY